MQNRNTEDDADIIWNLLAEKEQLSVGQIERLSTFNTYRINKALGWLAKEQKTRLIDRNGRVYVELSHCVSDLFY